MLKKKLTLPLLKKPIVKPATVKTPVKVPTLAAVKDSKATIKLQKLPTIAAPKAVPVAPSKTPLAVNSGAKDAKSGMAISIEVKDMGDKLPPGAEMVGHENLMIEESKEVKIKGANAANTTTHQKSNSTAVPIVA